MICCLARHTKNLLVPKQLYLVAALSWAGVIAFFCLVQLDTIPLGNVSNLDKLVHLFFHFVLTILWFLYLVKKINPINVRKAGLLAVLFSVFFGIAIEIVQEVFTLTRHGDVLDVFANVSGAICGVAVVILFQFRTRVK